MDRLQIVFMIGHFILALGLVVAGCALVAGALYAAGWVMEAWGRYTIEQDALLTKAITGKRVTDYYKRPMRQYPQATADYTTLRDAVQGDPVAAARIDFEHCYGSHDNQHCECWWDDTDSCCHCNDDSLNS